MALLVIPGQPESSETASLAVTGQAKSSEMASFAMTWQAKGLKVASLSITGQAESSGRVAAPSGGFVAVATSGVTVAVAATLGEAVDMCSPNTQYGGHIKRKIVDSVKTSGTIGLGSVETAGLEYAGSVWLGLLAAWNQPNISGESSTLDASLVCHETKPVARMGLAAEVHGGPSYAAIGAWGV